MVEPEDEGALIFDAELGGGWRRICHGGSVEGQMVESLGEMCVSRLMVMIESYLCDWTRLPFA